MRLDSACKYTKNNANHNSRVRGRICYMVGFRLQIY